MRAICAALAFLFAFVALAQPAEMRVDSVPCDCSATQAVDGEAP